MGVKWWSVWAMAGSLVACSSGGDGGDDRSGGNNNSGEPRAGGGAQGGDGPGGGAGTFSNPNGGPPMFMMPRMDDAGNPIQGDAGPCMVGQFCENNTPDPDNCGTIAFEPDVEITRTPGNVLIVFDQSISMEMEWPGTGMTKLDAARGALVAALMPLQGDINAAALFLPNQGCFTPFDPAFMGNAVLPIDDPSQINFMPGADFLMAWDSHWAGFMGGQLVGTPLQEGFDLAEEAITAAQANNLLAGNGQVVVVAFTDGEPNCVPDPMTTGRPTMDMAPRAADWLTREIKTYVVGLPGADQAANTLNAVANSGGTMEFVSPADPMALQTKLAEVVLETVSTGFNSCSMTIEPVPEVPDELQMIVEDAGAKATVPRDFGNAGGWTLDDQGHIEISGALCADAMSGRFSSITFEYACPTVPPPPPLLPPE